MVKHRHTRWLICQLIPANRNFLVFEPVNECKGVFTFTARYSSRPDHIPILDDAGDLV